MNIMVLPRDANPYQEQVYAAMPSARIAYLGEQTGSHSLNVAMLPVEITLARLRGFRVLHVHWVYRFALPRVSRFRAARRGMRLWFALTLLTARAAGVRVVWIAHNVLPHEQVFDDDVAGRRVLLRLADAVVAHTPRVLEELAAMSPLPPEQAVARHPAYDVSATDVKPTGPLRVLFFGAIAPYKGVTELIRAVSRSRVPIRLTVAGRCSDPMLRDELERLARESTQEVRLQLERLSDESLEQAVADCDLVALPFIRVTTSGSALFALSAGRPLIIPDVSTLSDLPEEAVFRYDACSDPIPALASLLEDVASSGDLPRKGRAAHSWAHEYTWTDLGVVLDRVSRPAEVAG